MLKVVTRRSSSEEHQATTINRSLKSVKEPTTIMHPSQLRIVNSDRLTPNSRFLRLDYVIASNFVQRRQPSNRSLLQIAKYNYNSDTTSWMAVLIKGLCLNIVLFQNNVGEVL